MDETSKPNPPDDQMEGVYQTYLEAFVMSATNTERLSTWVVSNVTEAERCAIALGTHHGRRESGPATKTQIRNLVRQMLALPQPAAQEPPIA